MINNIFHNIQTLSGSPEILRTLLSTEKVGAVEASGVTTGASTAESVLQILGLLVLFILIIVVAYFATKWLGNLSANGFSNKNITVVDTYKISPTKYIQIVKVTDKYFVIGVSKDDITFMGEVDKDKIIQKSDNEVPDFKEMLEKAFAKSKKKEIKNDVLQNVESEEKISDKTNDK